MSNYPGKLIVLYGINNLGKSTQAKLLVERLIKEGFAAEYLKYPIYDLNPSGEILNGYLRKGNFYNLDAKEAQIIYALNRTQYQEELINKLKAGTIVIAEDYKGTGIAWGIGAGVSEIFLKTINSHLIEEDLVFLFDGERFLQAVEKSHKHETNDDLTTKVRWAHLKLKEEYGWIKINANLKIEEIQEIIWEKTYNFLKNNKKDAPQDIKQTYNYSGFSALSDIINDKQSDIAYQTKEEKQNVESETTTKTEPEENSDIIIEIPDLINSALEELEKEEINEKEKKIKQEISEINIKERILKVERINKEAKLPLRAHESDAGMDLFSVDYYSIPPYGQALVQTGVKMEIPDNCAGLIWDKSSLASHGITTMGGVIDSGYRGEIKVLIKNLSEDDFNIVPGQKIAQIIIQELSKIKIIEEKLEQDTSRGEGGFGSSGKF